MMSTNKTTNYALHSWLPTDEFHLTEINENFAALDAALKSETTTLAAAVTGLGALETGSYAGNGAKSQEIVVGRKIKALLIETTKGERAGSGSLYSYGGLHVPGVPPYYKTCEINNDRFSVFCVSTASDSSNNVRLNAPNTKYVYLAWVE